MQTFVHYFLHIGFPLILAWLFFRENWKYTYFILLATMVVDLDHLVADPIFKANRCSIHFHFLHSFWAMIGYVVLLFFKKPYRIIGMGLLLHMLTDFIDCMFMFHKCNNCLSVSPIYSILKSISNLLGL